MDTHRQAELVQARVQAALSGAERFTIALEMSLLARELGLARLRRDLPGATEEELWSVLLRSLFGPGVLPQ